MDWGLSMVIKRFYTEAFFSLTFLLTPLAANAKNVGSCLESTRFRAVYCADLAASSLGSSNPSLRASGLKCAHDQTCWCRVAVVDNNERPILADLDPPNGEIPFAAGSPAFKSNVRSDYIADPSFLQVAKYDIDRNRNCTLARHKKGECALDIAAIEKKGTRFRLASVCNLTGRQYEEDFFVAGSPEKTVVKATGAPPSQPKQPPRRPVARQKPVGSFIGLYGVISIGNIAGTGAFLFATLGHESGIYWAQGISALMGASISACAGVIGGLISGPGCRQLSDIEDWAIGVCGGASVKALAGASAGVCMSAGLRSAPTFTGADKETLSRAVDELMSQTLGTTAAKTASTASDLGHKMVSNIVPCFAYGAFGEVCAGGGAAIGAIGIGKTIPLKKFTTGSWEDWGMRMMLGLPLR